MMHPWDIKEVHKGWSLTQVELAQITQQQPGTDAYNLAVVKLCKRLDRELREENRPCSVAIVKGSLKVLTDAEASEYEAKAQQRAIREIPRRDRKLHQINADNLTEPELEVHTKRLLASGQRVTAIRGARAAIRRVLKPNGNRRLGKGEE